MNKKTAKEILDSIVTDGTGIEVTQDEALMAMEEYASQFAPTLQEGDRKCEYCDGKGWYINEDHKNWPETQQKIDCYYCAEQHQTKLAQEGEQWVWRETTASDFENEDWEFSHYRYLDGIKLETQYFEVKDGRLQKIGGTGILPFSEIQILEHHPAKPTTLQQSANDLLEEIERHKEAVQQPEQQQAQQMEVYRWVKCSERNPEDAGDYHVKIAYEGLPESFNTEGVLCFTLGMWEVEDESENVIEWLEKTTITIPAQPVKGYTREQVQKIASDAWNACEKYQKSIKASKHSKFPDKATYLSSISPDKPVVTDKEIEELQELEDQLTILIADLGSDAISRTFLLWVEKRFEINSNRLSQLEAALKMDGIFPAQDSGRTFTETEITQLQSAVHKITGNGEVMQLFNKLLGVSVG